MRNLIIGVIALLVVVGGAFWFKNRPSPASTPENDAKVLAQGWDTFSKYLAALKAHDLPSLTTLSYQLSDTCKDPKQIKDCYAKMDSVYDSIKIFKEADFTHAVYDSKQAIIYTDWHNEKSDLAYGNARNIIYLVRKETGGMQVLSMSLPEEIVYTLIDKNDTDAMLQKELIPRIKDTDGDTLEDEVETCTYPSAPKTCVKTDPSKKDTDSDGWWDSIQTLFYTK